MRRTADLAREHGVRLHTHLAETKDEETFCLEMHGVRPVEYVRRLGWLGPDVWMAHSVHLSAEEVALFGETRTGVAHCPSSNFRLGSGVAPVRALLDASAPVGLGVDGSASNDSSNMLAEARQALLAHRIGQEPKRWLTAEEVLWMATRGGAACLGRDDIGSLEPGKAADLVLFLERSPSLANIHDPYQKLVYCASERDVAQVWVDGEPVVAQGRVLGVDVSALLPHARELAVKLATDAGLDSALAAPGR